MIEINASRLHALAIVATSTSGDDDRPQDNSLTDVLLTAIGRLAAFLGAGTDEAIDADAAVAQLEQLAHELRSLSSSDRERLAARSRR